MRTEGPSPEGPLADQGQSLGAGSGGPSSHPCASRIIWSLRRARGLTGLLTADPQPPTVAHLTVPAECRIHTRGLWAGQEGDQDSEGQGWCQRELEIKQRWVLSERKRGLPRRAETDPKPLVGERWGSRYPRAPGWKQVSGNRLWHLARANHTVPKPPACFQTPPPRGVPSPIRRPLPHEGSGLSGLGMPGPGTVWTDVNRSRAVLQWPRPRLGGHSSHWESWRAADETAASFLPGRSSPAVTTGDTLERETSHAKALKSVAVLKQEEKPLCDVSVLNYRSLKYKLGLSNTLNVLKISWGGKNLNWKNSNLGCEIAFPLNHLVKEWKWCLPDVFTGK